MPLIRNSLYNFLLILSLGVLHMFSLKVYAQSTMPHTLVYSSLPVLQKGVKLSPGKQILYPISVVSGNLVYVQNTSKKIILVKGPASLTQKIMEQKFKAEVGVSQAYFAYVLQKLSNNTNESARAFGGVSRGEQPMATLLPMHRETMVTNHVNFVWRSKPFQDIYYFNLLDSSFNTIRQYEVRDTVLDLDMDLTPGTYRWFVSDIKNGMADASVFEIEDPENMMVALAIEKELIMADSSSENILMLIAFYIEEGWLSKASAQIELLGMDLTYTKLAADLRQLILIDNTED